MNLLLNEGADELSDYTGELENADGAVEDMGETLVPIIREDVIPMLHNLTDEYTRHDIHIQSDTLMIAPSTSENTDRPGVIVQPPSGTRRDYNAFVSYRKLFATKVLSPAGNGKFV